MDRYQDSFPSGDAPRQESRGGSADPDGDLRERAVHRLRARRNLAVGILVYVLVNGMLVTIWARNGGGFFWPFFPIAFWGIGIFWQVLDAFGRGTSEERIQAEMRRLSGQGR
jgi:hypothetical protein